VRQRHAPGGASESQSRGHVRGSRRGRHEREDNPIVYRRSDGALRRCERCGARAHSRRARVKRRRRISAAGLALCMLADAASFATPFSAPRSERRTPHVDPAKQWVVFNFGNASAAQRLMRCAQRELPRCWQARKAGGCFRTVARSAQGPPRRATQSSPLRRRLRRESPNPDPADPPL